MRSLLCLSLLALASADGGNWTAVSPGGATTCSRRCRAARMGFRGSMSATRHSVHRATCCECFVCVQPLW